MSTVEKLKQEIRPIEVEMKLLNNRLESLCRELRDEESKAFIAANNICVEDVQMSSGEDIPWFGDIWTFTAWMKRKLTHQWMEWNGRIYSTSDLFNGRMPDVPGRVEHLKSRKAQP